MHILFLLISDQHIPNLLSVHHFRPDRLALGLTQPMERKHKVEHFLAALATGGLDYRDKHEIIRMDNAHSFQLLKNDIVKRFLQISPARWTCNITGGTKPMSIVAHEFFIEQRCKVVYIYDSSPDKILNVATGEIEVCRHRPSIAEFMAGYGHVNKKKLASIQRDEVNAESWWECSRLLALHCTGENWMKLSDERNGQCRNNGLVLEPEELCIENIDCREALSGTFGLEISGKFLSGKIDKYAGIFLTGDWLGFFFWRLLKKHETALGIWDLHPGLLPATSDKKAENDLDVAFMRGYQLCTIECKTGDQTHDDNAATALYKIDSVIKRFKALKAKAFLASTSDNIFDKGTENRKNSVMERAENLDLTVIDRNQIKRLAANPDDVTYVKEVFGWK